MNYGENRVLQDLCLLHIFEQVPILQCSQELCCYEIASVLIENVWAAFGYETQAILERLWE